MKNKWLIIVGAIFFLIILILFFILSKPAEVLVNVPKPSTEAKQEKVIKETIEGLSAYFGQDNEDTITLLENNKMVLYKLDDNLKKNFNKLGLEVLDYISFTYDIIDDDKFIKEIKKLPTANGEGTYLGQKDNNVKINTLGEELSFKLTDEVKQILKHVHEFDYVKFSYFEYKGEKYLSDIRQTIKEEQEIIGEFVEKNEEYIIIKYNDKELKLKYKEANQGEKEYGYIKDGLNFKQGDKVKFDYYSLNGEDFILNLNPIK